MRDRGIIISDAEMKYRRWLSLSEANKPPSASHDVSNSPTRPHTAPNLHMDRSLYPIKPTRSSLLRVENLQIPKVETDYHQLSIQKKQFEKKCRANSAAPVRTNNCPDHESFHEFIIGARYNCSHQIDSRSLERLGVYVPRENLSGTFINPGGILPHSKLIYHNGGKRSYSQSNKTETTTAMSFMDIPERHSLSMTSDSLIANSVPLSYEGSCKESSSNKSITSTKTEDITISESKGTTLDNEGLTPYTDDTGNITLRSTSNTPAYSITGDYHSINTFTATTNDSTLEYLSNETTSKDQSTSTDNNIPGSGTEINHNYDIVNESKEPAEVAADNTEGSRTASSTLFVDMSKLENEN
jgi:hypothetical protein